MNINPLRTQFLVYVLLADRFLTPEFKQLYASSGYEVYMLVDQSTLLEKMEAKIPHIVVFSPEVMKSGLSRFFERVLQINSEIQLVAYGPDQEISSLVEYRSYNLAAYVDAGDGAPFRSLWAIDAICEKLAYQYQNETLVQQLEEQKVKALELEHSLVRLQEKKQELLPSPINETVFQTLASSQSKEDLIHWFLSTFENVQRFYFKFLPSVSSFILLVAPGVPAEALKGIGVQLQPNDLKNLYLDLQQGRLPKSLSQMLMTAFKVGPVTAKALFAQGQLEGLIVIAAPSMSADQLVLFHLLEISYENLHFKKKVEALEVIDPVTELYNRSFFFLRLTEEVARARRLQKPISVVKLSLDMPMANSHESLSQDFRDQALKSIATLVKRTSRENDYCCRTGENEVSLILPHSDKKGGTLRAERIRRTIESQSFALNGRQVTVCAGVSEYPSLCNSVDSLDDSARQALIFASQKGGNKVCLYKPLENFRPEFVVHGT